MDDNVTSITHAGVVFIAFLFMMVTFYFLLSMPVEAIFDALGGASLGEATDEMAQFLPYFKIAVNMVFAISVALPVTWFIFWVFSREPAYGRIRYR